MKSLNLVLIPARVLVALVSEGGDTVGEFASGFAGLLKERVDESFVGDVRALGGDGPHAVEDETVLEREDASEFVLAVDRHAGLHHVRAVVERDHVGEEVALVAGQVPLHAGADSAGPRSKYMSARRSTEVPSGVSKPMSLAVFHVVLTAMPLPDRFSTCRSLRMGWLGSPA